MRLVVTFIFCLFAEALFSQPFNIGHIQQTFNDPSRANRTITTEIYYPAIASGDNTPVAAGQFPVLVFGHGFVMTWSAYDVIWNALVPEGYIMVFPTTEASFSPSHEDFAKDIAYLVGALKAEGLNVNSSLYGALATTSAVMGHSMGGGSAFLAVQYDSTITALATLAPAVTNPSSVSAATNITLPSIVFAGANDCVTPPVQHQLPMYDSLSSDCKTYLSITGGSHCQFAAYNLLCSIGESSCSPSPTITPSSQQTITFGLLLDWLDFYLKNDCNAGIDFQNSITIGMGITSNQNCMLICTGTDVVNYSSIKKIYIYPSIFNDKTFIKFNSNLKNGQLIIYNSTGQKVKQKKNITGKEIIFYRENLPVGIYFLHVIDEEEIIGIQKVVVY